MAGDYGACRSCRRRFVQSERIVVEVGGVRESLCSRCLTRLGGDKLGPAVYGRAEEIVRQLPPPAPQRAPRLPHASAVPDPIPAADPLGFGVGLET